MPDEATLIEAFKNGDAQAFEELYHLHVRSVFDFIYVRVRHRETAEDIVSQAFLNALEKIDTFDSRRGTFGAWIFRIARNVMIDHFRSAHPTQSIDDAWELPSSSDVPRDADAAIRLGEILALLKDLTPVQRDTVLLRAWHGKSFAEIAEILGSTEAASKMMYKRTVEKLKDALPVVLFLFLSSLS
jgi:RNA polymerase sigma-70 factor (ECF subfamily)